MTPPDVFLVFLAALFLLELFLFSFSGTNYISTYVKKVFLFCVPDLKIVPVNQVFSCAHFKCQVFLCKLFLP